MEANDYNMFIRKKGDLLIPAIHDFVQSFDSGELEFLSPFFCQIRKLLMLIKFSHCYFFLSMRFRAFVCVSNWRIRGSWYSMWECQVMMDEDDTNW